MAEKTKLIKTNNGLGWLRKKFEDTNGVIRIRNYFDICKIPDIS